jgi:hypothetical protein
MICDGFCIMQYASLLEDGLDDVNHYPMLRRATQWVTWTTKL